MNSLVKRIAAVERSRGVGQKVFCWVEYVAGGGLVYDGRFFEDGDTLAGELGVEPDDMVILGWRTG
jgi:predicted NBD/HSP70 family sugar kinase